MSKLHWELQIEGHGVVDLDELEYIADRLIEEYKDKPIVIDKDSPLIIHGEIHQGGDVDEILKEYSDSTTNVLDKKGE
mgnify:CR=1 FL=1